MGRVRYAYHPGVHHGAIGHELVAGAVLAGDIGLDALIDLGVHPLDLYGIGEDRVLRTYRAVLGQDLEHH